MIYVDTAAGILILVVTLVSVAVVGVLFVWAARKDGEEDLRRPPLPRGG